MKTSRLASTVDQEQWIIRALYMRLYHARMEGDDLYPLALCGTALPILDQRGHIERVGDCVRLTESGIHAWAAIAVPHINPWDHNNPKWRELFAYYGKGE